MAIRNPAPDQGATDDGPEVMAAIDGEGPDSRLVIADVSREEAWVSVVEDGAAELPAWR